MCTVCRFLGPNVACRYPYISWYATHPCFHDYIKSSNFENKVKNEKKKVLIIEFGNNVKKKFQNIYITIKKNKKKRKKTCSGVVERRRYEAMTK
tara:strand:- start:892 stop:1173 length:282 start_codon:yes stop_codon:yes gene_type:complete